MFLVFVRACVCVCVCVCVVAYLIYSQVLWAGLGLGFFRQRQVKDRLGLSKASGPERPAELPAPEDPCVSSATSALHGALSHLQH